MRTIVALSLCLLASGACPSPPPAPPPSSDAAPPPQRDGGAASPCDVACATLGSFGCPEATAPDCADVLLRVQMMRLVRTSSGAPLTCAAVTAARSAADARLLGIACAGPP